MLTFSIHNHKYPFNTSMNQNITGGSLVSTAVKIFILINMQFHQSRNGIGHQHNMFLFFFPALAYSSRFKDDIILHITSF